MGIKDTLIGIAKKPMFWVVLITLIVVVAAFATRSAVDPLCNPGEIYDKKCGKCRPVCPSGTPEYDCKTATCKCPADQPLCGGVCCDKDLCQKSPDGQTDICCTKEQTCMVDGKLTCCPAGTICKDGKCVAICGRSADGTVNMCSEDSTCVVVTGLTPNSVAKFKQEIADGDTNMVVNGDEAFICVKNTDSQCFFDNEKAVPAIQDNFYPCFSLPKTDQEAGLGYCASSGATSLADCYSKHKTKGECKDGCEWRDVLTEAGTDAGRSRLQSELDQITGMDYGYYCQKGDVPYTRVVAVQGTDVCDWKTCWSHLAGKNVIDVKWDDTTKQCTALQSCTGNVGMTNEVIKEDGTRVSNPFSAPPIPSNQNGDFPPCGGECPIESSGVSCESSTGKLVTPTKWVGVGANENFKCVQSKSVGAPFFSEKDCYIANCKQAGAGGTQKCCGDTGYIFDSTNFKCMMPDYIQHHCGGGGCHANAGLCGPDWRAHCRGNRWTSCHPYCVSDTADGPPVPARSARPFCKCNADDKKWYKSGTTINGVDITSHQYNTGMGSGSHDIVPCKLGENTETCVM